jgi:hypothetical protein
MCSDRYREEEQRQVRAAIYCKNIARRWLLDKLTEEEANEKLIGIET